MRRPFAERVFAHAVRMLPRDFIAAYGAEMEATFARRAAVARTHGPMRFARFVLRELGGIARIGVLEHAAATRPEASHPPFPRRKAVSPMEHVRREFLHAMRRLIRTPGFTAAAILTLAIAIGANTAIFTLLHRIALSPLPYPAAERLIVLDHTGPGWGGPAGLGMTTGLYREYAELSSVEAIAIYGSGERILAGEGEAESIEYLYATPSLGGILGIQPALGRWFTKEEGEAGAARVAVLTHGLWVRRFGASPAVLGRTIRLDGVAHEVIGVMPRGFVFRPDRIVLSEHGGDPQLVSPLRVDPEAARAGGFGYGGIARLRPGVTMERARRQQNAVIADLPSRFPAEPTLTQAIVGEVKLGSLARPLKDRVLGNATQILWVLLGSVAVVLLIACANLANLFLVRTQSRQREIAVRRALGAGTAKVAVHFLAETLLVAVLSGALGLLLGYVAVQVLVLNAPIELPRLHEVRLDGVVVAFAALASVLAGLSLGVMPLARRLPAIAPVLQDTGRGSTVGVNRMRARQGLVAAQVSLAVVLLVAAGLMAQSFQRIRNVDPGFGAESRLVFRIGLPGSAYETDDEARAFHEMLLERLRGLPAVRRGALSTTLPLEGDGRAEPLVVRGSPVERAQLNPPARLRLVSSDYFVAMAIPAREGRLFDHADVSGNTNAAVINEALASLYFPGTDPIGEQLRVSDDEETGGWFTVVGVVGNTATNDLREPEPAPKMYVPLRSGVSSDMPSARGATYVLHTSSNPIALVPAVRRALEELDPNVALARPERLSDIVARAGARLAFTAVLLVLAASVALSLGLVGVYAVIAYSVAQRRAEIGVRLTLGAAPGDVAGMVLRQSGRVIALGVLLGLGAAVASMHLLQALLFGVAWNDGLTYVAVAVGLFGVAMLACWLPARRAARLDPAESLRA